MIIGAGLAGLIAAYVFPQHDVLEAAPEPEQRHKALLRFRSTGISELTGIPFRPVTVRKGIYHDGSFREPDISLANRYSLKVIGRLVDRSIWDLAPVTRFVAPESLYEQMVDAVSSRITWGHVYDYAIARAQRPVISTVPLPIALDKLGVAIGATLNYSEISVLRFRVSSSDVFQTVYYPSSNHNMYRASITGNLLIVEFVGEPKGDWERELDESFVCAAFGSIGEVKQRYGKIAPIDNDVRRRAISRLTDEFGVYSLGRFATWRNILLDDVLHDARVVQRLIAATPYERRLYEQS